MGTFSDWSGPQTGASVGALTKFIDAYESMKREFEAHKNAELTNEAHDPHKVKAYIDAELTALSKKTDNSNQGVIKLLTYLAGIEHLPVSVQDIQDHITSKLDREDLITYTCALKARVDELEAELNKLSMLQFDNVPVGGGIRWWRDTLPEDGTYVWANGQTLYGVNQNFPELARVWELDSADNVKVPKEDHTIFKVRKATVEIKPIEHAYIAAASGSETPGNGD